MTRSRGRGGSARGATSDRPSGAVRSDRPVPIARWRYLALSSVIAAASVIALSAVVGPAPAEAAPRPPAMGSGIDPVAHVGPAVDDWRAADAAPGAEVGSGGATGTGAALGPGRGPTAGGGTAIVGGGTVDALARHLGDGSEGDGEPGQPPPPTQSPADVRQSADDILDSAEFQRPEPNVIDKARAWVEERLGRILEGLVTGDGASLLGWVVLVAAVVAIVVLLSRLGRSVQRDPGRAVEISVERSRTADQWAAEAERLEGEGEWKRALRCRFRALVATLVEQGRVDDVPGRTTGEYRAEVDVALPEVAADFAEATFLFEDAWYGDEPTGAVENARFRSLADTVVSVSARRPAHGGVVTEAEAVSA